MGATIVYRDKDGARFYETVSPAVSLAVGLALKNGSVSVQEVLDELRERGSPITSRTSVYQTLNNERRANALFQTTGGRGEQRFVLAAPYRDGWIQTFDIAHGLAPETEPPPCKIPIRRALSLARLDKTTKMSEQARRERFRKHFPAPQEIAQ